MTYTHCPNCTSEIRTSFLGSVQLASEGMNLLIKDFGDGYSDNYCTACMLPFKNAALPKYLKEKESKLVVLNEFINLVPIVTIHNPLNWDYTVLGMVSAQIVSGTGVVAEIASTFTDFFGTQSGTYNKKLEDSENNCRNILRKKTLDMGGNAVIGTDIDYSEAGGMKGMLMVCMAGTAVNLKNIDVLGSVDENMTKLDEANKWLLKYKDLPIY